MISICQSRRSWYWRLSTPVTSHYLQLMEKLAVRNTWCQYSDSCYNSQNKDATDWRRGNEDYLLNSSLTGSMTRILATIYQKNWLIWAKNDSWIIWSMTSFFWMESDPSSLISFILSLIWLESGFNQITVLIITAKQMLPRRRGRLIDEKFEKLNKGKMFFWHFSFSLTLCLLSRSADREKGTVCMINKSEAITKVYVVFTSLHWQTLYPAPPPAPVFQAEKRFNMLLP